MHRLARLKSWWNAERSRHFLWLPVCFAVGIALYYALPVEPPVYLFPVLAALVSAVFWRVPSTRIPPIMALLLALLGASWADVRANAHNPVMLHEVLSPRVVLGNVRDIERTQSGVRLLLDHLTIDDFPSEKTPQRIRLSVKFKKEAVFDLPAIGDAISIRAGLMPAMGPALPGGFDFARFFYFRDIGAVGYGLPPWEIVGSNANDARMNGFWSWRANLTHHIVTSLGPQTGGIAAGLITGDAKAIAQEDFEALRASNLYHIIAISGEHMVVIAGVIFISLRMLLLLLPKRIGLRPQVKTIAAVVTLLLVTIYLFVTGLPTSAVRAYVMIVLVLLAVIFRRHVNPMRSLAITALAMLMYDPATLLDPGFQLSFAATLAILALVEARMMAPLPALEQGRVRKLLHHIATILLVSVVAEAATAPLVISMFNNLSFYGVLANSLATPLVSLFLMPLVALFFILQPLGLGGFVLTLMHYGITALLGLARWVASFPHAQIFVPSLPGYGLALFALGLVWVCLWQTRARRYGLVAMLLGVASLATVQLPDLLMGGNLKQIAMRTDAGYVLARGRADAMIPEMWAHGLGLEHLEKAEAPHWRCDKLGCVAQVAGQTIAFPSDSAALAEDCAHAQIIVSTLTALRCDSKATILDADHLLSGAVTAFWMGEKGALRIENSADWQGSRPWTVRNADGEEE